MIHRIVRTVRIQIPLVAVLGLAEVGIAVGFCRRTILPDDAVGAPLLILHIQSYSGNALPHSLTS